MDLIMKLGQLCIIIMMKLILMPFSCPWCRQFFQRLTGRFGDGCIIKKERQYAMLNNDLIRVSWSFKASGHAIDVLFVKIPWWWKRSGTVFLGGAVGYKKRWGFGVRRSIESKHEVAELTICCHKTPNPPLIEYWDHTNGLAWPVVHPPTHLEWLVLSLQHIVLHKTHNPWK